MLISATRRVIYAVALAFALSAPFPECATLPVTVSLSHDAPEQSVRHDRAEEYFSTGKLFKESLSAAGEEGVAAAHGRRLKRREAVQVGLHKADTQGDRPETMLIEPIDTPFKQREGEWEIVGLSLTALGEPKSGTTWLGRIIVELCVQLCGNAENPWCKMGGLKITDVPPAPRYSFEMLHADTDELFLHFNGDPKHVIPGLGDAECMGRMRVHPNSFGGAYPCKGDSNVSREKLLRCLPAVTPECVSHLLPLDPARRRIAVIFRDPRNLIISEHRMRRTVYHQIVAELEPFILERFAKVVAWIHQRYTWHTTALQEISHVMFYEDLQMHPHHLADLAAFVGLNCTAKEADDVFQRHIYANPPGDYTTYGLSFKTLEWMNATMAETLPEAMLARYELTPVY